MLVVMKCIATAEHLDPVQRGSGLDRARCVQYQACWLVCRLLQDGHLARSKLHPGGCYGAYAVWIRA